MINKMTPTVLISLLNWNHWEETVRCVHSLLRLEYVNFEIIIVDNNSEDDSVQSIRRDFPHIQVIEAPSNGGYAAGHELTANIALKRRFDLLWILNNDLTVRSNTLSSLVEAYNQHGEALYGSVTLLSEDPDVINFGGGAVYEPDSKVFSYNAFNNLSYPDAFNGKTIRDVQTVEGSSFLVPVSVIEKYGFMDTSWFMYGEETDYCFRLRKKKIPSFIVCDSVVIHEGSGSLTGDDGLSLVGAYYRRRNYLRFAKAHLGFTQKECIALAGGAIPLMKFFFRFWLSGAQFRQQHKNDYYLNIATIHGILGIKGKTVRPEKF